MPFQNFLLKVIALGTVITMVISCNQAPKKNDDVPDTTSAEQPSIEAITLLGDTLFTPKIRPGRSKDNFEAVFQAYQKFPDSVEALIWYGRRTAYLGHFQKAISIYSEGIQKFPEDARLYRHRGHRYISSRQYDKAIADFKKAAALMDDRPDQTEPDGLPNSRNIPISTLKGNIWYHLGLAYYLKGDLENALSAFQKREVTNKYDDNLVSGGHWLYMILKRMDKDSEALAEIEKVNPDMDIIENKSYYEMCLFYKGLLEEEDLNISGEFSSSDDVHYYGLGNWNLYEKKDAFQAKRLYKRLLDNGNPYSFAYLAAEADWKRLFQ